MGWRGTQTADKGIHQLSTGGAVSSSKQGKFNEEPWLLQFVLNAINLILPRELK